MKKAPVEFACQYCGAIALRSGNYQKYCEPCSEAKSYERKAAWTAAHRKQAKPGAYVGRNAARRAAMAPRALELSKADRTSIAGCHTPPDLDWLVRIAMPYSKVASKNAIYAMREIGHVAIRRESRQWRDALTLKLKAALRGRVLKQNKVWVDIFVQKTSNKSDAINVVDLVCDAVKVAVGVDDRWFCIRSVDWEITRHEPMIYVGVGQEDVQDVQACSSCGRLLTFDNFSKSGGRLHGIGRECRECRSASDRYNRLKRKLAQGDVL